MTPDKNPHAVALGALGGVAGRGPAKARTPRQARRAGRARWAGMTKAQRSAAMMEIRARPKPPPIVP